jgi:hypothetical protein
MNVMLIELLLWICLLLFFWAMRDGLNNIESDIESLGLLRNAPRGLPAQQGMRYSRPQTRMEPIGSYRGEQIYRYVVIEGRRYQFDHVCTAGGIETINDGECCIEPGLMYFECQGPGQV